MDNASSYGMNDSRFDPWQTRSFFFFKQVVDRNTNIRSSTAVEIIVITYFTPSFAQSLFNLSWIQWMVCGAMDNVSFIDLVLPNDFLNKLLIKMLILYITITPTSTASFTFEVIKSDDVNYINWYIRWLRVFRILYLNCLERSLGYNQ